MAPRVARDPGARAALNTAAPLGNALGVSAFVVLAAAVPGPPAAGLRVACAAAFAVLQRRG